jgi:hypothetical protein
MPNPQSLFSLDRCAWGWYPLHGKVIVEAKSMQELRDALDQIAEIRQQVARTVMFRGYRALPVALSGLLAFATAGLQIVALPDANDRPFAFFALWIGTACLSVLATAVELICRLRRFASALERDKSLQAASQFAPCLVAGALLMLVLWRFAPESVWMLPGLWAMFFGLGIFASWRFLPQAVGGVGMYYLVAGLMCLILARGEAALSPWSMGLSFGIGQLLTAGVLYWSLERTDEQE